MLEHPTNPPQVVDLNLSDQEYLELLAQGRDPVREWLYEQELLGYGFPAEGARQVAPLFDRAHSIDEKILVSKALKHIWEQLMGQPLYRSEPTAS